MLPLQLSRRITLIQSFKTHPILKSQTDETDNLNQLSGIIASPVILLRGITTFVHRFTMKNYYHCLLTLPLLSCNAAINFCNSHPSRAPPGIFTKNLPQFWGFCILIFAQGVGIYWSRSRGAGICLWTTLAIFGIFIIITRIGNRQHFGVYFVL